MTTTAPPQTFWQKLVSRNDLWALRIVVAATAAILLIDLVRDLIRAIAGHGFTFHSLQRLDPTPLEGAKQVDGITASVVRTIDWQFDHPSFGQSLLFLTPEIHTALFFAAIAWMTWRLVGELLIDAPFTKRATTATTWLSILMAVWVASHWAMAALREMLLSPGPRVLDTWNAHWAVSPLEWFLFLLAGGSTLLVWSFKKAAEHQHDIETLV